MATEMVTQIKAMVKESFALVAGGPDLSLSVERILTLVTSRVSIEILFSDLKKHLRMKDWQCRIERTVVRSVPLTCVATTLLTLWSLVEASE